MLEAGEGGLGRSVRPCSQSRSSVPPSRQRRAPPRRSSGAVSTPARSPLPRSARIYWTNFNGNSISYALNVSGGGNLNTTGANGRRTVRRRDRPRRRPALLGKRRRRHDLLRKFERIRRGRPGHHRRPVEAPDGLAIDATTGKVYWANYRGESIGFASLSGGNGGQVDTHSTLDTPAGLAIDPACKRSSGPMKVSIRSAQPVCWGALRRSRRQVARLWKQRTSPSRWKALETSTSQRSKDCTSRVPSSPVHRERGGVTRSNRSSTGHRRASLINGSATSMPPSPSRR
jgi:hypothetical protein